MSDLGEPLFPTTSTPARFPDDIDRTPDTEQPMPKKSAPPAPTVPATAPGPERRHPPREDEPT